jgi:hypothetical protein
MLEPQEKEIDEIKFRYQPMMLKPSRAMFDGIAQRFGPAIASAVEGLSDADIENDMEFERMLGNVSKSAGGLLRGIVAGLDASYHEKLANELANQTEYVNEAGNWVPLVPAVREIMFGAKLLTETRLIMWCLGVQYADFLEPLRGLGMKALALRRMGASPSASPTE